MALTIYVYCGSYVRTISIRLFFARFARVFADGTTRIYNDDAAQIMRAEIVFAVNTYRAFITGLQNSQPSPLIVPPDFTGGKIN